MKTKILGLMAIGLLAGPMAAKATPLLNGPANGATGVTGLVVGTSTYDVTFIALSYSAAYPGNDAPFLGDPAGAAAVNTALTAFLNSSAVTGLLSFECEIGTDRCYLTTPTTSFPGANVAVGPYLGRVGSNGYWIEGVTNGHTVDCVGAVTGFPCYNPGITGFQAIAHFEDVTPVPSPGTLGLFSIGLAGLVLSRRRKH